MASVSTENLNGRKRYRVTFRDEHGKRRFLRLPGVTKKDASEVASKVQAIVSARITGAPLGNAVAEWLAAIGDELHMKLATAGLTEVRKRMTLGDWLSHYVESRRETVAPGSILNWKATTGKLLKHFGKDCDLRSITKVEAAEWQRTLAAKYARATVSNHTKKAKQFFNAAVEEGQLEVSPFAGLVAGSQVNDERKQFVTTEDIGKVIAVAPNAEWRLLIALARYGGLRNPSETIALQWSDINWEANTLRVPSPKTARYGKGHREVPIFGELLPYLEETFEQAADGAVHCIERYRAPSVNLRTGLLRLIERAGLTAWPKPWHALRASRETELTEDFPLHVVTAWLGHTPRVAEQHYLQVTADHLKRAIEGSAEGVAQQVAQQAIADARKEHKTVCHLAPLSPENVVSTAEKWQFEYTPEDSNL